MDANMAANMTASILTIFRNFNHPCVLVGQVAHRWMGCGGCVDEAIDLLVRDDQFTLITAAFIDSGYWGALDPRFDKADNKTEIDLPKLEDYQDCQALDRLKDDQLPEDDEDDVDDNFYKYCCDADQALQLIGKEYHEWPFGYVRLWSEQTFRINVDESVLLHVPTLTHGWPLLVETDFHPAANRTDGWDFGPKKLSSLDNGLVAIGEAPEKSLFIPNIPSYLDALVYHATHYSNTKPRLAFMSKWQIRNLTRYLYLELPGLRNHILFQVEASTERFLEDYFNKYKRKPFGVFSKDGRFVLVERHRPETYPELFSRHTDTCQSKAG